MHLAKSGVKLTLDYIVLDWRQRVAAVSHPKKIFLYLGNYLGRKEVSASRWVLETSQIYNEPPDYRATKLISPALGRDQCQEATTGEASASMTC